MNTSKPLTPRQQAFVRAYGTGKMTAKAAMVDAGYSAKSARCGVFPMLRHPIVAAELAKLKEKLDRTVVYNANRRSKNRDARARVISSEVIPESRLIEHDATGDGSTDQYTRPDMDA